MKQTKVPPRQPGFFFKLFLLFIILYYYYYYFAKFRSILLLILLFLNMNIQLEKGGDLQMNRVLAESKLQSFFVC